MLKKKPRRRGFLGGVPGDLFNGLEHGIGLIAGAIEQAVMALLGKFTKRKELPPPQKFVEAVTPIVVKGVDKMMKEAQRGLRIADKAGKKVAKRDLEVLVRKAPKPPRSHKGVTVRAPISLVEDIEKLKGRIVNDCHDMYRTVVNRMAANPPESDTVRLRIAQQVLNDYADRGITGFVDKGGRRWNLVSYVEMATRTAANHMASNAYLEAVSDKGYDVVRMTVMPDCSDLCLPLQGRLWSITGMTTGVYGGQVVQGSLAEARARGWLHPNCRHTVHVWVPGMEFVPPHLIDPGDYAATQELRRLERKVRQWKRRQAGALTPMERQQAGEKVRQWQGEIRRHVARTGTPRKRQREQIDRVL